MLIVLATFSTCISSYRFHIRQLFCEQQSQCAPAVTQESVSHCSQVSNSSVTAQTAWSGTLVSSYLLQRQHENKGNTLEPLNPHSLYCKPATWEFLSHKACKFLNTFCIWLVGNLSLIQYKYILFKLFFFFFVEGFEFD